MPTRATLRRRKFVSFSLLFCVDRRLPVLLSFPIFQYWHHVGQCTKLCRNASGHCRRNLQRLMNAHEIVVHEVNRHHMSVVFCLLLESIGEPRHAPVAHPDRKIAALYKRRADMLGIGIAFDAVLVRASADGWAVTALTFRGCTVNLH